MVKEPGKMERSMKENFPSENLKVMEKSYGQREVLMKANLKMDIDTERACS